MSNEMTRKYAVVDLEATNAGATAAIIQVGLSLLREKKLSKLTRQILIPMSPYPIILRL